ncbi:Rrf2 family transcriptional regulator [Ligilactobacillus acidipiscis]|uniref:Rrf2 family transcriptional regulator n=1 Tax=Ligilactobacillus acidipiscis TaxID=89059 RepID=UPI0022DF0599|nr:Rrf2 family transcriptional regulator [Ligilactobacillus acidipiscis]
MKNSLQFSDTVHIISYIAVYQNTDRLSSKDIAESVQTNPTNVRKIMGNLRNAGLIKTTNGRADPSIARSVYEISFYDIYQSLDNKELFHVDTNTEPKCVVGGNIQEILQDEYAILQATVEEKMKQISLGSVLHQLAASETKKRQENQDIVAKFL